MFIDLTIFIYQYSTSTAEDVLDVVGWGADEFEDKYLGNKGKI